MSIAFWTTLIGVDVEAKVEVKLECRIQNSEFRGRDQVQDSRFKVQG